MLPMLGAVVVYAGLIVALAGAVAVAKPVGFLRIPTRRRGAFVVAAGLAVIMVGMALPTRETRVAAPTARLDEFAPVYQFAERHRTAIDAPVSHVYRAVHEVTANEIRFFRTLTWIRRLGRPGPESVLDAPERLPLLQVATRTTFRTLAEEPPWEVVVGTVVLAPRQARVDRPSVERFQTLDEPGFAKAAMNFRLEETGPETCMLTTETRVFATDPGARRRFAVYWRWIYPGSALIRRMWLRAIKNRAESTFSAALS